MDDELGVRTRGERTTSNRRSQRERVRAREEQAARIQRQHLAREVERLTRSRWSQLERVDGNTRRRRDRRHGGDQDIRRGGVGTVTNQSGITRVSFDARGGIRDGEIGTVINRPTTEDTVGVGVRDD